MIIGVSMFLTGVVLLAADMRRAKSSNLAKFALINLVLGLVIICGALTIGYLDKMAERFNG
jgi:uncharacterized membrane protein